ncbi:uncharacterized protein LOC128092802 [Culex pipiens pallens]|uniref:uncharacterized protein LOC128092802 n=1 Tax=Culex pipiens pallens TaxID=42434 RepID=UPI0022AB4DCF|nr:uncharacterized protein LOC128092802 [Culex pipiens pallens]
MFMKLLLLAIVLVGFAQADVPGTLVSSAKAGARRSLARSTQQCDGVNFLPPSCDSCTSIQACMGPVGTVYRDCELLNPEKPFCNNGECSATPSLGDHCIPNQIHCLGSGYYPDALACNLYHYCDAANLPSDVYRCPDGFVFNPETTLCKLKKSDADCMKISCNKNEILSPYGTSKQFFGFCMIFDYIVPSMIRVGKCSPGTEFDGHKCVYKCTAAGRFPDSEDPTVFYECWENGSGFESGSSICNSGKTFDAETGVCKM